MSAPKRGRPAPRPSASTRAPSARTAAGRAPARRPAAPRQPVPRTPPSRSAARLVHRPSAAPPPPPVTRPWNALWAMMIGFFMILVDSTIVAVANPSIMENLGTDYDAVIWVTSAYLLAYAVPLLVAGRLGDQFGPKKLYLLGLFVFTAASLWCGFAGSIEMLIAARVVQGIGAALLTPQTLSTITRIFPPAGRGVAMSVWGATAGVATLVGPLAGGVLVDHLGWQWIFFVNVPIGVIGMLLGLWLIPVLPTHRHRFDVLGVLLSGAAMFLVVFGLQEGESRQWAMWIWATIAAGVLLMAVFLYWQAVNKNEPLIPLAIFRDRDFSLSNIGVAVIGFVVTAMIVPVMFYAQVVSGLTPTRSALLTAPMAVMSGVLAPLVGRIVDRTHPRNVIGFGFAVLAIALTWLSIEMTPTTAIWRLVLPFLAMGAAMAFIFAPLAATATRNLPPQLAGAGSGVYNATRQLGSVLGSAGIAAFMTARISAEMPGDAQARPPAGHAASMQLPEFLREPFSAALSQSMLLPAFIALFGVLAALFMVGMVRSDGAGRLIGPAPAPADSLAAPQPPAPPPATGDQRVGVRTEVIPLLPDHFDNAGYGLSAHPEGYIDDDEDGYVEYLITLPVDPSVIRRPSEQTAPVTPGDRDGPADLEGFGGDDRVTEPLALVVEYPGESPAETWEYTPYRDSQPGPSGHRVHDEAFEAFEDARFDAAADEPVRPPVPEPIGHAHNGFHVDANERFQPVAPPPQPPGAPPVDGFDRLAHQIDTFSASFTELLDRQEDSLSAEFPDFGNIGSADERPARHSMPDRNHPGERGRHYRDDPDDSSHGRHSMPWHD